MDSTGGRGGGVQNVSDWNAGGNAAASVVFDVAAVSNVAAVPDAAASILFEAVTDAAVIVAVPDAVTVLDTAAASDAAASDAAAVPVFAAGAASGKNKSVGGDVLIPVGDGAGGGVEVVVDA